MVRSIMTVMELIENSNITEQTIFNSLDSFKDKPIILDLCKETKIVGHIEDIEYVGGKFVSAIVVFYDEKYKRDKYENWCIELDKDNNKFDLIHVEI